MNKNIFTLAFGLAVLGCSSDSLPVSEAPSFSMREASSTLSLRTRTPAPELRYYVTPGKGYGSATFGRESGPSVTSCAENVTLGTGPNVTFSTLPPGDYHIYAVGSDDLSAFTLPSAEEASDTALITPTTDFPEHDLLLADTLFTLAAGDNATIDITFHRALLRLDTVTLHQVPNDATAASLTLSPLHQNVTLGKGYGSATFGRESGPSVTSCAGNVTEGPVPSVTFTIPLSKSDATTWQSTTSYYIFPSVGAPTLTISLTCPSEDDPSVPTTTTYTHTLDTPLEPNHPIALDATLPDDSSSDFPAVGTTYLGCYVLASDPVAQTLTLLSPNQNSGYSLGSNQSTSINNLNAALATWPTPNGLTGNWRIPTAEEALDFLKVRGVIPLPDLGKSDYYVCMEGNTLTTAIIRNAYSGIPEYKILQNLGYQSYLRPVMDIVMSH